MELEKIYFSTAQVSKMLGVDRKTVCNYCRKKYIQSERNGERGNYSIRGDVLLEFIYRHPTALYYLKKVMPRSEPVQSMIKELSAREKVYSVYEVMGMFGVSKTAVLYWVTKGYLPVFSYENPHHQNPAFRKQDIHTLLRTRPYLRKFYTDYDRRAN